MVNMPTSKRKTTTKQEPKEPARTFHNKKDLINQIVYDYEREMIDSGLPKIVVDKIF